MIRSKGYRLLILRMMKAYKAALNLRITLGQPNRSIIIFFVILFHRLLMTAISMLRMASG